jgi:hypothetical protein
MAEKRVSVRLVAEGGRQVRAELEGIGDAGARGFGRLSTEMELANTRLANFARKAGIALAAVTVAAAAAGVAMVREGLETIGAQADMAASLKTTVESLQVLTWAGELAGVSMGEIEQATKKLTTRLSEAAAGSGLAVGALERLNLTAARLQALPLDQRIVAIQEALNRFVPAAERAAVASDLFGDKAALAFLRIDPATLREAAQDVRDFGVAVSAADAAQIERTGDAIAKLSLIWLGLTNRLTAAVAPALETVANTLADMARSTGPIGIAINSLFDNIGRLTTYAATFATLMAGRWVAGLAAAALSVRGLATGLVILRGALIRTGIGALIVGAGELVFQFTRLVAGAGGFGAAIGLLKDLALEVWDRIGLGAASAWSKIEASWAGLQATIYGAMQSSVEAVTSFGNSAAGIFKGAYEAVKAIWVQLPGAIGDFAFQAANGLIGGVEAMLNGVVTRINNFINGLNAALDLLPDWAVGPVALGRIDNPFAGSAAAAGTAAAEAFSAAMAQTYVTTPDLGLTGMAEKATARAEAYREASGMLADAAARPMQSWQALKDAVAGAGTEGETALDGAAEAANRLDESMTEAGRAAGGAGAAAAAGAEVAKTGWEAAVATLADYAAKARDIGGDIGNALVSAFTSAENAVGDFVKTGKLDFRDLVTSMIADLAKLAARRFILGPIANALSGALSGAGGIFANVLHAGGMVGSPGPGRVVPALAFANAPRMHAGGWAGIKPDEVPAILQRGERVLSRREAAGYGQGQCATPNVSVTIMARDAESFRQSRTQVAADIARAVSLGRRGM